MSDYKDQVIDFIHKAHVRSPAQSGASLEMLVNMMHPLDGLMAKLGPGHLWLPTVEKLAELRRIPTQVEANMTRSMAPHAPGPQQRSLPTAKPAF